MYQEINQTDEEKIALYMKQPKRELAKMLCNCNALLSDLPKYNQELDNGYCGTFTYIKDYTKKLMKDDKLKKYYTEASFFDYDNKAILNKNRRVKNVVNK